MTHTEVPTFVHRLGDELERVARAKPAPRPQLPRLTLAAAAVAVLAIAMFIVPGVLRPSATIAAVDVRIDDGHIVAVIEEVEADADSLRAAFLQHGIDIEVRTVPVSPRLVGRITSIGDDGRDGRPITDLSGDCPAFEPCELIGLRIPLDYRGHATIEIGRAARPDETYTVSTDAFVRGEALHCSGLYNAPTEDAIEWLAARGLRADWRVDTIRNGGPYTETATDDEVGGRYVGSATSIGPTTIVIWANPRPESPPAEYLAAIQQGC